MTKLLSAKDTASYIGISVFTLYRHWQEWGLVPYRIAGKLKFRQKDVDLYLERNKVK